MPSIFGIPDSELSQSVDNSMSATLTKWGNETIDKLRKTLEQRTSKGTSRDLMDSLITLPINYSGDKWLLTFKAEDYWKYINKGVSGVGGQNKSKGTTYLNKAPESPFKYTTKKPPINVSDTGGASLRQWAYNKGINEYAVRESIFRQGIKATHFFDDVISREWIGELVKRLEKSGARELEISFSKEFK